MRTIAVIGAGISGLAAAYLLSRRHRVHLFEREGRLGGHTHTVLIDGPDGVFPLDTGFLVHNDRTYPQLVRLFAELGVATRDSDMSFAVSCPRTGLEYSSRGANGFFAQRRNLVSRAHLSLLGEIVRFNREAPALLSAPDAERHTLGDFLESRRFGASFTSQVPAADGLGDLVGLRGGDPVVPGADARPLLPESRPPLTERAADVEGRRRRQPQLHSPPDRPGRAHPSGRSHRGCAAWPHRRHRHVARPPGDDVRRGGVRLCRRPGAAAPRRRERSRARPVLELYDNDQRRLAPYRCGRCCRASRGRAPRGTTCSATPPARRRWSPTISTGSRGCGRRRRSCVTLNPDGRIDERTVLRRLEYRHPLYTRAAILAQARWAEVSGVNRTHYCGAYWRYGFHEDGLASAIRVADRLGVPW